MYLKKRWFALLMVITTALFLTACGGGEVKSSEDATKTDTSKVMVHFVRKKAIQTSLMHQSQTMVKKVFVNNKATSKVTIPSSKAETVAKN